MTDRGLIEAALIALGGSLFTALVALLQGIRNGWTIRLVASQSDALAAKSDAIHGQNETLKSQGAHITELVNSKMSNALAEIERRAAENSELRAIIIELRTVITGLRTEVVDLQARFVAKA